MTKCSHLHYMSAPDSPYWEYHTYVSRDAGEKDGKPFPARNFKIYWLNYETILVGDILRKDRCRKTPAGKSIGLQRTLFKKPLLRAPIIRHKDGKRYVDGIFQHCEVSMTKQKARKLVYKPGHVDDLSLAGLSLKGPVDQIRLSLTSLTLQADQMSP